MWAAEPWLLRKDDMASCWDRKRDAHDQWQSAQDYFLNARWGGSCNTNWYEGNAGGHDENILGAQNFLPTGWFPHDAPALLGFDESIDEHCWAHGGFGSHAMACIHAGFNILSLYGNRVPYNICRNLEWQVCAVKGLIPGQGGKKIVFGKRPGDLNPSPDGGKPLGTCGGWVPNYLQNKHCNGNYATDDIFFLEVCMFNQICKNGDDLWLLEVGQEWECEFDEWRFDELQDILLTPPSKGYAAKAALEPDDVDPVSAADPSCRLPGTTCEETCVTRRNIREGCDREMNFLKQADDGSVVAAALARAGGPCKWCSEIHRRDECTTSYFVDLWMAEAHIPAFRLCHWDDLSGMCDTAGQSTTCAPLK